MLRTLFFNVLVACISMAAEAQEIARSVVSAGGGSVVVGGVQLDQNIGETVTSTAQVGAVLLNQGFEQAAPLRLQLDVRAFLQGPFNATTMRMSDALRTAGYLPMTEPYTALGYNPISGGGERTRPNVLAVSGDDAIIDWVFIELRSGADNTNVIATRSALLQADGDVVDADGSPSVAFDAPAGSYFICMRHRNHLAVLTLAPVALGTSTTAVDLTDGSTPTYGTEAQAIDAGARLLWCGDVNSDGRVQYTGLGNDRDPVLVAIGGTVPTNTTTGYHASDVNMDGSVKYVGANNDRDPMLVNIGGNVPTNVRNAQLP